MLYKFKLGNKITDIAKLKIKIFVIITYFYLNFYTNKQLKNDNEIKF